MNRVNWLISLFNNLRVVALISINVESTRNILEFQDCALTLIFKAFHESIFISDQTKMSSSIPSYMHCFIIITISGC